MHSVGLKKRAVAYLIDMILLIGILMLLMYFVPESHNVSVLNQEFNEINDLLFSHQISFLSYLNRISSVMLDLDKEHILYSIINAIYILLYFVILPCKTGKTFGMQALGLRYAKKEGRITFDDLLVRSMVTNGLLYLLASLVLIYLLPGLSYFIISIFLAILQISLVIISIFMVIYRHDNRGLQDLLSKTIIVTDKK